MRDYLGYFVNLGTLNHGHQEVHEFERFETGASIHVSVDNADLSNRKIGFQMCTGLFG